MLRYTGFDAQLVQITRSLTEGIQAVSAEQPDLVFFLCPVPFQAEEWEFIRDILQTFPGKIVVAGIFDIQDAVPSDRAYYFPLPLDTDDVWEVLKQIFQRIEISGENKGPYPS
jgi:hypothetical protein